MGLFSQVLTRVLLGFGSGLALLRLGFGLVSAQIQHEFGLISATFENTGPQLVHIKDAQIDQSMKFLLQIHCFFSNLIVKEIDSNVPTFLCMHKKQIF